MRPTTPGILLLFLVLAALAAPMAAVGQTQGPSALWDAYPLDPPNTTPAPATAAPPAAETPVPEAPPAAAPEPSGDDGIPIWAIIAGAFALLVVGGGVVIFMLARLRDRRQTATAAHPAPAREPEAAPDRDPMPVAAPVAVAAAPAPPRAAEPIARTAPATPAPAPAAPVTTAPPAPPPEPATAPATAVGADDDLELAELAAEYLWTVATGSRRPVVDLATRRFLRVGRAREMLSRARSRGILTGAGRGRPGGALTEKGRRLLEAGSRATHAPGRQDPDQPPEPAASETAAAPPPRLRLADGDEDTTGSLSALGAGSEEGEAPGRTFTVLEGGARNLS